MAMRDSEAYGDHRRALSAIAKETREVTPIIMADIPHLNATNSELLTLGDDLPMLDPSRCPQFATNGYLGTPIRVVNKDAFDAAIALRDSAAPTLAAVMTESSLPEHIQIGRVGRVAVLNLASERNPGGGWLGGASAQEEALCFRSSLAASLHKRFYPLPTRGGIYTPDVVLFRSSMAAGHRLLVPEMAALSLPVVSVLSVAAIRRPKVKREVIIVRNTSTATHDAVLSRDELRQVRREKKNKALGEEEKQVGRLLFADPEARVLTKDKMRLCLRMAASRGHVLLVLGAMGCGAFRNPPEEVADCWLEVLSEEEFAVGWFKEIWFAVYDRRGGGNFETFESALDGKVVGRQPKEKIPPYQ